GPTNGSRHQCVDRRNCRAVSDGELPLVLFINMDRKACVAVGTCAEQKPIESRYGPSGRDPGFECEVGQRWRIRRPRNADVTAFEIDAGWQILASLSERVAGHDRSLVQIKRWIEINRRIAHRC